MVISNLKGPLDCKMCNIIFFFTCCVQQQRPTERSGCPHSAWQPLLNLPSFSSLPPLSSRRGGILGFSSLWCHNWFDTLLIAHPGHWQCSECGVGVGFCILSTMQMHQQSISVSRKCFFRGGCKQAVFGIAVVLYGMLIVQSCSV